MATMWFPRQRPALLAAAAGMPLLWCAIAGQLRDDLTAATAALVLVLLIVAAAATGDRWAGVLAAVSGGLWFDYFLTSPFNRFTIDAADDVEVTVLLVLVGIAVTEVALWGRRQQAQASRRAGYLDGVMTTSQIVSGEFSAAALADEVAGQITDLLDVDSTRFVVGGTARAHTAILGPDGEITTHGARVNVARNGLPALEEIVLPAQHHGVVHGLFVITASTRVVRPSLEQRQVAVLLANQVGSALAPDTQSR